MTSGTSGALPTGWALGLALLAGGAVALAFLLRSQHEQEFGPASRGLAGIALLTGVGLGAAAATGILDEGAIEVALFIRAACVVGTVLGLVVVVGQLVHRPVPPLLLWSLAALGAVRLVLWLTTDLVFAHRLDAAGWPVYGIGHHVTAALSYPFVLGWLTATWRAWDDRFERRAMLVGLGGTMVVGLVATFGTTLAREVAVAGLGVPVLAGVVVVFRHRCRQLAARHAAVDLEREELARELAHRNEQLREALAIRDDLFDAVSHELRTPLTPIRGHAETLRNRLDRMAPNDVAAALDAIERNGERLLRLVDEMLMARDLRPDATTPVVDGTVDLVAVVRRAVADLGPVASEVVLPASELPARASEQQVAHVLDRLVTNAATHGRPPVVIQLDETADHAELRVRDQGPGVPAAIRETVFDPFTQASRGSTRTPGGVGLGLYTARRLTEAMGGTLTLADDGSEFVLRLPLARAREHELHTDPR